MSFNKILFIVALFMTNSIFAGTVVQVKNKRALIRLDGDQVSVGQRISVVDDSGNETAILTVRAVKGGRAIGQIMKGSVTAGNKTQVKSASSSSSSGATQAKKSSRSSSKPSAKKIRATDNRMFFQARFLMDTISAKQKNADLPPMEETVDMSGSNFGASLGMDFSLSDAFAIRATGGFEMLKVTGDLNILGCDGMSSRTCDVNINYLTVSAALKAQKTFSSLILWAGVGAMIKQPISKKSTALNEGNIQMANSIFGVAGIDYFLSSKFFVPASFEYHYSLNTSDTVPTISQMAMTIGLGWTY